MKKLLAKKHDADTECDGCGERFPPWDALEKKSASEAVRRQVKQIESKGERLDMSNVPRWSRHPTPVFIRWKNGMLIAIT